MTFDIGVLAGLTQATVLLPGTGLGRAAALMHRELQLFAAFWLSVGMLDDLAIDLIWLRHILARRARTGRLPPGYATQPLRGPIAVLIPAWREAEVIGTTIHHALQVWPQTGLRLLVGCYANDPGTVAAAERAMDGDRRAQVVILPVAGPTTKADCLNHLFQALTAEEARRGASVRAVVLHDAEDMVHPAALAVLDAALDEADFVQLPVRAEPLASSRWVAGHYLDEFAEAHAKSMVVRDRLGAALPAAGVGCAILRTLLEVLADECSGPGKAPMAAGTAARGPFTPDSLTEDYEIGWRIARLGARARFLRLHDSAGQLVATRAYFPDTLDSAVRQKTRWTHGIAYQAWDHLGWSGPWVDRWMALRDRRAPFAAGVMMAAYASLLIGFVLAVGGAAPASALPPSLAAICLGGLCWRLALRCGYSAHEYGLAEGLRAILRAPLANAIAILSAQRALRAYLRCLWGAPVQWDKTAHRRHPARADTRG